MLKTGSRIALFAASVFFLLCCTAGVFLLAVSPTAALQSEYDAVLGLDSSLRDLERAAYRAALLSPEAARPEISSARESLSRDIERAMGLARVSRAASGSPFLRSELDGLVGAADSLSLALDSRLDSREAAFALSAGVDKARKSVAAARPLVARAIERIRLVTYTVSGAIIVGTWLLGLLVVRFLTLSLSRSSRKAVELLDAILERRITESSETPDAKGGSGPHIDESIRKDPLVERILRLSSLLRETTAAIAGDLGIAREANMSIFTSIGNTSSTFEVVDGFIENIRGEVNSLEEQVRTVKQGLERVTSGLEHLDTGILNQKGVVEGSLESVNGMIGSISEMAEKAARDERVVQDLVVSSAESQELFSSTYQKITVIRDSISRINGMAEVIDNIAEQTSMLSLNAAIEAAHAGEAGKGFAVVAEEITKLAEAASDSSREISLSIDEIVENITSMAQSSGRLDESFTQMTGDIKLVHRTISDFSQGLKDSSRNTKGVLETMRTLDEVSQGVTRDSGLMSEGAGEIAHSMRELEMISSRVFDGITAMSLMIDGLKDVMAEFSRVSDDVKRSGLSMQGHLERLK